MSGRTLLLALLLSLPVSQLFAHALWIETRATGKKGQKQEVRIVYSEPGDEPEKVKDWYSDIREFSLWLIGPDNTRKQLTVTPADNHFVAEFTPEQDGVYTLAVRHDAKDLGGTTKYQFNATATVAVGAKAAKQPASGHEIDVVRDLSKPYKVGKPVLLTGLFKDAPAEKLTVSVHSPSGWNREVVTNTTGVAEFIPLWPGTYRIEASRSQKEDGEHHGKAYKAVWRCATQVFEVAP